MRALILAACFFLAGFLGASEKYLTPRDMRCIREHWQDYKYASEKTGVPLLILAAIHYRESHLFTGWYSHKRQEVVKNIGGPFMLDLGPLNNGEEFKRRIRAYEKKVYNLYVGESNRIPKVSHVFRFAALVAAHHLKGHLRGKEWTEASLADACWGYNGRASWCKQSESPYLWSDPKRGTNLILRYKRRDGEIVKSIDQRPGVMILYKELLETMGGKK